MICELSANRSVVGADTQVPWRTWQGTVRTRI